MKPGDAQAERCVVRYYLLERLADPRTSPLRPEHFADSHHRRWWEQALSRKGEFTTVDLGMKPEQASIIAEAHASSHQVPGLERRIIELWGVRHVAAAASEFCDDFRKGKVTDLNDALGLLGGAAGEAQAGMLRRSEDLRTVGTRALDGWRESVQSGHQHARTIPMPWPRLQTHFGGWVRRKLHVVGGRTSEHKTTAVRQAAAFAAYHGFRTLFWTMEDSAEDLACRSIAATVDGLDVGSLAIGTLPRGTDSLRGVALEQEARRYLEQREGQLLRFIDQPAPTLRQVIGTLKAEATQGLDMIILDYLQLVQHDRGGDRDAGFWRTVTSRLAGLAKELDIVMLVTSQIDKVGTRNSDVGDRPPRSSDMLFSTALIQDAFAVGMVHVKRHEGERTNELIFSFEKWKSAKPRAFKMAVIPSRDTLEDAC